MKAKFDLLLIFRWVDNNLCVKRALSTVSMLNLVQASERLGVKTNSTKYSEFNTQQSFIGFLWNMKDFTVGLLSEKLLKRRQEIDESWNRTSLRKVNLEKINGQINHLTLILPQLRPYLTANFRWLARWSKPVTMRAPEDVLDDMMFWRQMLTTLSPTRLIAETVECNISWVEDASTEYGIGILVGKTWLQFQWLEGWSTPPDKPKRSIAWA